MGELRREVIVPRGQDVVAFHRRIAILSICVALMAGGLDAVMWRSAAVSDQAQIDADIAAERAALERDYRAVEADFELRERQRTLRELEAELLELERERAVLEREMGERQRVTP